MANFGTHEPSANGSEDKVFLLVLCSERGAAHDVAAGCLATLG